ncbi:MAG: NAD-dependent deacylase [Myxococcales bacterium]|nr:NAD-dependent deacylase [Myxococcales bacterium]
MSTVEMPIKALPFEPDARVTILTGAGASADSGVPTFRDPGGLWRRIDPNTIATARGFFADPVRGWALYHELRTHVRACEPNAAHHAISAFQAEHRGVVRLITQNVDGLHLRAGARELIEIHGNLFHTRCGDETCDLAPFFDERPEAATDHRCPSCGGVLRPDVVWFGEPNDLELEREVSEALASCDWYLAIGTSGTVYPAALYARFAKKNGAQTVIVNLELPENAGDFDLHYTGRAAEVVPILLGRP